MFWREGESRSEQNKERGSSLWQQVIAHIITEGLIMEAGIREHSMCMEILCARRSLFRQGCRKRVRHSLRGQAARWRETETVL